jgi:hypothetical protein
MLLPVSVLLLCRLGGFRKLFSVCFHFPNAFTLLIFFRISIKCSQQFVMQLSQRYNFLSPFCLEDNFVCLMECRLWRWFTCEHEKRRETWRERNEELTNRRYQRRCIYICQKSLIFWNVLFFPLIFIVSVLAAALYNFKWLLSTFRRNNDGYRWTRHCQKLRFHARSYNISLTF